MIATGRVLRTAASESSIAVTACLGRTRVRVSAVPKADADNCPASPLRRTQAYANQCMAIIVLN